MKLWFSVPEFFPPLKFLHGLINSDAWVVFDHLKYQIRSRQNRCRIRTATGVQLLSVAVKRPCNKAICFTMIDNFQPWRNDFLSAIQRNYVDTPFFPYYIDGLTSFIQGPNALLETLNVRTILWMAGLMKKHIELIYTKNYFSPHPKSKTSSKRAISSLCAKLGGEIFQEEFKHPYYQQKFEPFEKELSTLDALFNLGAMETRKLLGK